MVAACSAYDDRKITNSLSRSVLRPYEMETIGGGGCGVGGAAASAAAYGRLAGRSDAPGSGGPVNSYTGARGGNAARPAWRKRSSARPPSGNIVELYRPRCPRAHCVDGAAGRNHCSWQRIMEQRKKK